MKTVIIGAGISGLSFAHNLKRLRCNLKRLRHNLGRLRHNLRKSGEDFEIFEKENKTGGLCTTETIKTKYGDFLFDKAGHVLHMRKQYVKNLLKDFIKEEFIKLKRSSFVFFAEGLGGKGRYIPYPFQASISHLPENIAKECLSGFIKSKFKESFPPNFYEWILNNFGNGIAKHFMIPYNEKLWKTDLRKITCDWTSNFIPLPSLDDVCSQFVRNLGVQTLEHGHHSGDTGTQTLEHGYHYRNPDKQFGYNPIFFYPKHGGIETLTKFFLKDIGNKIKLKKHLILVDIKKRVLIFKDGTIANFNRLISTIPIPELISCIKDCPDEIMKATKLLRCNSLLVINIGINERIKNKFHWIYFSQKKYPFYRLVFPANLSENNVPKNMSSILAEISYFKHINKTKAIEDTINGILHIGLLSSSTRKIIFHKVQNIPYAYVVFDRFREKALLKIQKFLNKNNIYSIGRYGKWNYSSIENNIVKNYTNRSFTKFP